MRQDPKAPWAERSRVSQSENVFDDCGEVQREGEGETAQIISPW